MNPSIEVAARNIIASMKRAYGAPYTRVRALEIAWRHFISRPTNERADRDE